MGVKMAEHLKRLKPDGGTVCLQLGNVAADNINERAAGLPRHDRRREGHRAARRRRRLDGDRRLPGLHQRRHPDRRTSRCADVLTANPDLDAFILVGGWAQFGPRGLRARSRPGRRRKLDSKELVIIAGDTLPPQMDALKAGHSHAQVGQRPFEMGYRAPDG